MSIPSTIASFYNEVWNAGDASKLESIVAPDFAFRGSLGERTVGVDAFWDYVCRVRAALAVYRCEIVDCVTEGDKACAKMRFSGRHVGPFLGYTPTNRVVTWDGAAFFRVDSGHIVDVWVIGDLDGLRQHLDANQARSPATRHTEGGQPTF